MKTTIELSFSPIYKPLRFYGNRITCNTMRLKDKFGMLPTNNIMSFEFKIYNGDEITIVPFELRIDKTGNAHQIFTTNKDWSVQIARALLNMIF